MSWTPPPTGYGTGVPGVPGLEFAGVPARFVAWLIDVFILALVGGIVSIPLYILFLGTVDWSDFVARSTGPTAFGGLYTAGGFLVVALIVGLISLAIDAAYFVLQWSSGARATLGMRILHLQIGHAATGHTLTREAGFRRWIAMGSWTSLLGFVPVVGALRGLLILLWYIVLLATTASSPTRQGAHDRFAESAIVQPAGTSNTGLIIGCLILLAVFAILPLVAIIALIFLGGQVSTILSTVGDSI